MHQIQAHLPCRRHDLGRYFRIRSGFAHKPTAQQTIRWKSCRFHCRFNCKNPPNRAIGASKASGANSQQLLIIAGAVRRWHWAFWAQSSSRFCALPKHRQQTDPRLISPPLLVPRHYTILTLDVAPKVIQKPDHALNASDLDERFSRIFPMDSAGQRPSSKSVTWPLARANQTALMPIRPARPYSCHRKDAWRHSMRTDSLVSKPWSSRCFEYLLEGKTRRPAADPIWISL